MVGVLINIIQKIDEKKIKNIFSKRFKKIRLELISYYISLFKTDCCNTQTSLLAKPHSFNSGDAFFSKIIILHVIFHALVYSFPR
jgi:hypothetical protein